MRRQPGSWRITAREEKAFNALVGRVMKATQGKANPAQSTRSCAETGLGFGASRATVCRPSPFRHGTTRPCGRRVLVAALRRAARPAERHRSKAFALAVASGRSDGLAFSSSQRFLSSRTWCGSRFPFVAGDAPGEHGLALDALVVGRDPRAFAASSSSTWPCRPCRTPSRRRSPAGACQRRRCAPWHSGCGRHRLDVAVARHVELGGAQGEVLARCSAATLSFLAVGGGFRVARLDLLGGGRGVVRLRTAPLGGSRTSARWRRRAGMSPTWVTPFSSTQRYAAWALPIAIATTTRNSTFFIVILVRRLHSRDAVATAVILDSFDVRLLVRPGAKGGQDVVERGDG